MPKDDSRSRRVGDQAGAETLATPGPEACEIICADGFALAANLFVPPGTRDLQRFVQINSATAVPQELYSKFARYLAAEGFTVLTFDYRGIGRSLRTSLRAFEGRMMDWGEKDLVAVIDWVTGGASRTSEMGR